MIDEVVAEDACIVQSEKMTVETAYDGHKIDGILDGQGV
jgi:hypothetical protein